MEKVAEKRSKEKFITDESGRKVSVILSYRKYQQLMRDLHDLAVIAERRDEESIPFSEFEEKLKENGRI